MCNAIKSNGEKCKISPQKNVCHVHKDVKILEATSETESSSSESVVSVSDNEIEETVARKEATLNDCKSWLSDNANSAFQVEYRLLDKDTNSYMHSPKSATVIRVEFNNNKRAFFWLYSAVDAVKFAEFVGIQLKLEPHNMICAPISRMFFDIDMKLMKMELEDMANHYGYNTSTFNSNEAMDIVATHLCSVYTDALKISLEESGADDEDLSNIDWMLTTRNRRVGDKFKVSLHIITNLMLPIEICSAVVSDIKTISMYQNEECLNIPDGYIDTIIDAIDIMPYGQNKSLGMPYGYKYGQYQNRIMKTYDVPNQSYLLTNRDQFTIDKMDTSGYNLNVSSSKMGEPASSDFVQRALAHVKDIPGWSDEIFSANLNALKGSTMFVKRHRSSFCSRCSRNHDNDNTLFLAFNSSSGTASWKCRRSTDKLAVFYTELPDSDEADIEAFALKPLPKISAIPVAALPRNSKKSKDDIQYPRFKRHYDGIPPMFDRTYQSSYFDVIKLSEETISMETLFDFIKNNIAFIQNGGNCYFLTKSRDDFGKISYNTIDGNKIKNFSMAIHINDDIVYDQAGNVLQTRLTDSPMTINLIEAIQKYKNSITFDRVDFIPFNAKTGQYDPKDPSKKYDWNSNKVFNTFTGFVNQYDSEFTVDESKFKTFSKHLREAWCDDNEDLFQYTLKLNAWYVQRPFEKSQVCPVITSKEGAGKNILNNQMANHIIGNQYCMETPQMKLLTGRFNHAREGKLLTVLNEAAQTSKSSASDQEVLKDVITESSVLIERKGIDPYRVADRNNVIIFSNNDYSVKASSEMRRFVFYKMSNKFIGDSAHFDQLRKEFDHDSAGIHLYHHLMNLDISSFRPQTDAPITDTKIEMRKMAIEKPIRYLIDSINAEFEDDVLCKFDSDEEKFITIDMLHNDFIRWLAINSVGVSYTRDRFSKSLTKLLGENQRKRVVSGLRQRGYTLSVNLLKQAITEYTKHADLFD